ncbi:hypothetical protein [Halocella sp. SP3-1]|uniref:phage tail tube protein n=1 Tax=Halocella sp. SP3-1 TaxID=2382161 RepID=UPI000F759FEC|nr:hypothetical protein [Halocella sp. SP3-1]AZO95281.1 hypothetical protein D7D81_12140 [Halocella sp. SP3-1]
MAVSKKIPAKDWKFEVDDGTDTDTFAEVKGLNTFSIEPSSNRTDVTDFDSNGDEEGYISTRGKAITLEGNYLEDTSTGDRDPGQERIEAVGELTGADSIVSFRITSPGGTTYTFDVTVDSAFATGGGHQDNTAWTANLTRSGSTTKA